VLPAKFFGLHLRADRDEANAQRAVLGVVTGLAQLRERFREKRSTDVPQPDDERRKRDGQRRYLGGKVVADARHVQGCHRRVFAAPGPRSSGRSAVAAHARLCYTEPDGRLGALAFRKKDEFMRTLLRVSMQTDTANAAVKDGTLPMVMRSALEALKPEAAYFCTQDGRRTAFIVFDLQNASDMPSIAEPFFMALNASVDFSPCMNADDLRIGLDKAAATREKAPVLH
jgi:hypothetical protein